MDKRRVIYIVEWGIAIAACVWLVWKLAMYEHYDIVAASLRAMGWKEWGALALALALMPVNMSLEAWRWRTLLIHNAQCTMHNFSFAEAQRQVYYSKLAGLITPWRLGEYPARGLLMNGENGANGENGGIWPKVLSMGAVGSATMTAAIVGVGALALAFSEPVLKLLGDSYLYALVAVILVLSVILYFAPQALKKWVQLNGTLVWKSIGQSAIRLTCWCAQLALVLLALKGLALSDLSEVSVWLNMPIYYLLVTITPNVPIVEAGVRGAWAIAVFGTMNAALAGVLLWVINTLLPCIIWLFIRKNAVTSARPFPFGTGS